MLNLTGALKSRFCRRLLHLYFLLRRPMTLGVRAIVLDRAQARILLVRHTYVQGWHLPGGGVDPGETLPAALERELFEETGVRPLSQPVLRSVHFNRASSRRDHVILYLTTGEEPAQPHPPSMEIAESRFFPLADLPEDVHPSTRRRIDEYLGAAPAAPFW